MSPVVLVLIIVGALLFLGAVAVVGTGFFLVHKARQAGIDPQLWQKNPGVAAAKMIAAGNPDVEIVKLDEGSGIVTLREKSTGKTVTLNFEDIKQGRISFTGDNGETATVSTSGEGETGSVEVKTGEGTARFGTGSEANLPSWVPVLQGSTPESVTSNDSAKGSGGRYTFNTSQKAPAVMQSYKDALAKAGFEVKTNSTPFGNIIEGKNGRRTVLVTVSNTGAETGVHVVFEESK